MSGDQTTVLETLVGDGKKFKTAEDLARGKVEADAFIDNLKGQIESLKVEIEKSGSNTDRNKILEELMTKLTNNTTETPETPVTQPPASTNNQGSGLTHDDVVKLLEARDAEAMAARNFVAAMTPFKKAFGDKAPEALATKAAELGMTVDELTNLAKRSPQAFISVTGLNATRDNTTRSMANHSSVSVPGVAGPDGVRNKAYYDKLQQEMGTRKFIMDSGVQARLHSDMMALGDEWDS